MDLSAGGLLQPADAPIPRSSPGRPIPLDHARWNDGWIALRLGPLYDTTSAGDLCKD